MQCISGRGEWKITMCYKIREKRFRITQYSKGRTTISLLEDIDRDGTCTAFSSIAVSKLKTTVPFQIFHLSNGGVTLNPNYPIDLECSSHPENLVMTFSWIINVKIQMKHILIMFVHE